MLQGQGSDNSRGVHGQAQGKPRLGNPNQPSCEGEGHEAEEGGGEEGEDSLLHRCLPCPPPPHPLPLPLPLPLFPSLVAIPRRRPQCSPG